MCACLCVRLCDCASVVVILAVNIPPNLASCIKNGQVCRLWDSSPAAQRQRFHTGIITCSSPALFQLLQAVFSVEVCQHAKDLLQQKKKRGIFLNPLSFAPIILCVIREAGCPSCSCSGLFCLLIFPVIILPLLSRSRSSEPQDKAIPSGDCMRRHSLMALARCWASHEMKAHGV